MFANNLFSQFALVEVSRRARFESGLFCTIMQRLKTPNSTRTMRCAHSDINTLQKLPSTKFLSIRRQMTIHFPLDAHIVRNDDIRIQQSADVVIDFPSYSPFVAFSLTVGRVLVVDRHNAHGTYRPTFLHLKLVAEQKMKYQAVTLSAPRQHSVFLVFRMECPAGSCIGFLDLKVGYVCDTAIRDIAVGTEFVMFCARRAWMSP